MTAEFVYRNWGLVVAGALLCAVLVVVLLARLNGSRRGRLAARHREVAAVRRELGRARRNLDTRQRQLGRLQARSDSVRPRHLAEAEGRLEDARALLRIIEDRKLVAENHLRKFIYEEFPPASHERLRRRFLPDDVVDGRPFSF